MNKDANVLELAQLVAQELCEEESKDQSVRLAGLLHGLGRRAVKESRSDVAEIYNPRRFTPVANRLGLKAGFAVDLEIQKEDGSYWDLTKRSDVEEVKALLAWEKPLFLMGSPPCGPFSPLQALNTKRVDPATASARLEEGRVHLNNSVECYEAQLSAGRLFLHEHPRGAKSWDEPCMKRLTSRPDVYVVDGPMCRWKMKSCDASGEGYVKKMTRWVTNSGILAKILKGECNGTLHRHVHLVNGRAREAQKYPAPLVRAILKGVQKELLKVGELSSLSSKLAGPVPEEPEPEVDWDSYKVPSAGKVYYDSNTGAELDPEQVVKARTDELGWIHRQKVYTKVPLEECYQNTGHPPITLKWLDRNKGDEQRPNYRSRLVVREVKKSSRTDVLPEHVVLGYAASRGIETAMFYYGFNEDQQSRQAFEAKALRHQSCTFLRRIPKEGLYQSSGRRRISWTLRSFVEDDVWHPRCQQCLAGNLHGAAKAKWHHPWSRLASGVLLEVSRHQAVGAWRRFSSSRGRGRTEFSFWSSCSEI